MTFCFNKNVSRSCQRFEFQPPRRTYPTTTTTTPSRTRISSSSSSAAVSGGWRNVSSASPAKRPESSAAPQNVSMHTPRHRKPDPAAGGSYTPSSRGNTTMYTVSKYQASGEISHNSFDGRYY